MTIRNEVTHKGVKSLKPATVSQVLSTVRHLLWQLDAAAGMEWAAEYAAPHDQPDDIVAT